MLSPFEQLLQSAGLLQENYTGRSLRSEWDVREINLAASRAFVERHHYARGGSNTRVFTHGLFKRGDQDLMGVVWWLPPTKAAAKSVNKEHWRRVLALTRMVLHPTCPKNAASFLLSRSVRVIWKDGRFVSLVTYADESQGHLGGVYRAANWTYVGRTGPYPRWINPASGQQIARLATRTRRNAEMLTLVYVQQGLFFKHKFVLHRSQAVA
jgi:hypothetical protein